MCCVIARWMSPLSLHMFKGGELRKCVCGGGGGEGRGSAERSGGFVVPVSASLVPDILVERGWVAGEGRFCFVRRCHMNGKHDHTTAKC